MPEVSDEELARFKELEKRTHELEREASKAKSPGQIEAVDDKLAALKREISDQISRLHAEDTHEREQLKVQLNEIKEFQDYLKRKQEETDRVKSSNSTIVIPPSDLGKQAPPPETSQTVDSRPVETPRRRGWRDWW